MIHRINLILQALNVSARQFAEEIGIQPSGMSHILSGRNNPSLDFVLKVINRYPDISTDWLLFGKGAMYITSNSNPNSIQASNDIHSGCDVTNTPPIADTPNLFSDVVDDDSFVESAHIAQNKSLERSNIVSSDSDMECDKIAKVMETDAPMQSNAISRCKEKKLVKIVMFYDDLSFMEYHPS